MLISALGLSLSNRPVKMRTDIINADQILKDRGIYITLKREKESKKIINPVYAFKANNQEK